MIGCIIIVAIIVLLSFLFSVFKDFKKSMKDKKFKKGKVICNVCGCTTEIYKEYTYEVMENHYGIEHYYDCFDCPYCGCQIVLKERKK